MNDTFKLTSGTYRKKPMPVEAFRWTGSELDPLPGWFRIAMEERAVTFFADQAMIKTSEGTMRADAGDWIIKGIRGELYPCKADIFADSYEPVPEDENMAEGR